MTRTRANLNVIVLLIVALSLTGSVGGGSPAFKAEKLSVLVAEETTQRTSATDAAIAAVQQAVVAAKGNFRRFDKDQTDFSNDDPWVAEAWKVKGDKVPWVVGADARHGVNQSLPTTSREDAVKVLAPLGVH